MPDAEEATRPNLKPRIDKLQILTGALGPVPKCTIEIRPLTVLIGGQGTGKSLIAQVLYALEELPFLFSVAAETRGNARATGPKLFRWVLDHLRSADRAFATFASPGVKISWQRGDHGGWIEGAPKDFVFSMLRVNRTVTLGKESNQFTENLRAAVASTRDPPIHHGIYFPTERLAFAGRSSRLRVKAERTPLTFDVFDHWLEEHIVPWRDDWDAAVAQPVERQINALGESALSGRARKHGERWKWSIGVGKGDPLFDLDMASSGQRANFAIPLVARTLPSAGDRGEIGRDLTLYLEEPEISLHPSAVWDVVRIVALLVNAGFRAVITTHSLTIIYALNNLLQASRVNGSQHGVPPPEMRLKATDIAVWSFETGKGPRDLVDRKAAFIDESALGSVGERLAEELTDIGAQLTPEAAGKER